jgi:short-subunit dehydrogenase
MDKQRKTALVTGASTGIGEAYCHALAQAGYDVVLVSRNETRLQAVATAIKAAHGVEAYVFPQDLSIQEAAKRIFTYTQTQQLTIDFLVNNAGFGDVGKFIDHPLSEHNAMLQAMLGAVVELSHYYLPGMIERREGAIINVASVVGLMGRSLRSKVMRALYRPIKCFVIAFTEQLQVAYQDTGVYFQCLCPGLTISHFHERVGQADLYKTTPAWLWLSSEAVAMRSLQAATRGRPLVLVTGWINHVGIFLHKLTSLFRS